jgi:imidazolonepropionase-like amidohydrolase
MPRIAFKNAVLFDGRQRELFTGRTILVEDQRVLDVGVDLSSGTAEVIDCAGRTLMPGLIDAHVHILATDVNLTTLERVSKSYLYAQTRHVLEGMLQRGFTTVRDAGGADRGFADAIEHGLLVGPRLFVAGAAISQTGGHGDLRSPVRPAYSCACCNLVGVLGRIADGVSAVQQAVRDEIRLGAHHVKVMASGGAASLTDPIENTQYSIKELTAIVEEARAANTYVMAHAYTSRAISRAVECGVRSIEHGNLLDEASATLMREKGVFLVPTLISSDTLVRFGEELGSPAESMRKIRQVRDLGLAAVATARRCGTQIGFGSDLLGMRLHPYQGEEFVLRAKVEDPIDTLLSATGVNADLMMQRGRLGEVSPGALADLIVVDGDPTQNPALLHSQGNDIPLIMKNGALVKNKLI